MNGPATIRPPSGPQCTHLRDVAAVVWGLSVPVLGCTIQLLCKSGECSRCSTNSSNESWAISLCRTPLEEAILPIQLDSLRICW